MVATNEVESCNDRNAIDFDKYVKTFDTFDSFCPKEDEGGLLPKGIIRVRDEAIASERLQDVKMEKTGDGKVVIAAFDLDGTCINGSSPKRLVNVLAKRRRISPYKLLRVGLWGLAYKLNLPKDAEGVRKRVFSAFAGLPAIKVNRFMCDFYTSKVAPHFRKDADAEMIAHLEAGHVVILVSASFEPIVAAAMLEHPIQYALASRMHIDGHGNYTDEVEGLPTEGADKIVVLENFANDYFGEGNWELGWSYADHYSDLEMLAAAKNPCPVTPDAKLRRVAKEKGWNILDWQ